MKRLFATVAVLSCVTLTSPKAQSPDVFTADDILKVATVSVLDFSDDGHRVAAASRRLYDNAEINHRRYGDPTYFAPSMVELLVIDTRTGAIDRPSKGLLNIRQAAW